ncbi:hypothetical protein GVN22_25055 [Cellulophaga sp. BC115SP]|nr:hypothetical protein [Cellulophaga sp. BC115SP]
MSRTTGMYHYIYRSYWNSKFRKSNRIDTKASKLYFTARPNPGAGIGHQLANWIAGYWWCSYFNLEFVHIPFASEEWEFFLGLGESEIRISPLLKQGYKTVLLPLFDENNINEVNIISRIIASYKGEKIIFVCEYDQFLYNQFNVSQALKFKFFNAKARDNDSLIFKKTDINIAVHIRRGDIVQKKVKKNDNLTMRWQENDYFVNVLSSLIPKIKSEKPIRIFIFSQGSIDELKEFNRFANVEFCLEMDPINTFLHLVKANILITSKSSFSYKPALISNGLKISPKSFWHGYPENNNWLLVEEDGIVRSNEIFL